MLNGKLNSIIELFNKIFYELFNEIFIFFNHGNDIFVVVSIFIFYILMILGFNSWNICKLAV